MSGLLRRCVENLTAIAMDPASPPEDALHRVRYMGFSADERHRFAPERITWWAPEAWFPMGLRTAEDIVEHELAAYEVSGIEPAMLRRAAVCCPHCLRMRVAHGQLTFSRRPSGKYVGITALLRRLHAAQQLPTLDAYLCDRDVCVTDDKCAKGTPRAPIMVHAKQATHLNLLTIPESTFFSSYGGNAAWETGRQALQSAARSMPWDERADQLFFRGSGAGFRKFLNYSQACSLVLPGTDIGLRCPWLKAARPTPFVPMAQQCGNKYLLHLPGTWPGHSNKLKQLMACGVVVVHPQNAWCGCRLPRPCSHAPTLGHADARAARARAVRAHWLT